ncbi:MAG: hypothetical protein PW786_11970 [Arachidicoccus sp.]|nr:hypothetical protein [Arachidicoccus sp.]
MDEDGHTQGYVSDGIVYLQITLDEYNLRATSQEYTMETILHEVIHAYLSAVTNTYSDPDNWQHQAMVGWVDCEREALQEIFPSLPAADANALAISGLKNAAGINTSMFNDLLTTYGLTDQQIVNTEQSYQLPHGSGKGTPCD